MISLDNIHAAGGPVGVQRKNDTKDVSFNQACGRPSPCQSYFNAINMNHSHCLSTDL